MRTGKVYPKRRFACIGGERVHQAGIGNHHDCLFQSRCVYHLRRNELGFRRKEGSKKHVRAASRHFHQDSAHVHIADVDAALEDDFAAQAGEGRAHNAGKTFSIGAAVVDGCHFARAQGAICKLSCQQTLKAVIWRDAIVPRSPHAAGLRIRAG